jgi:hypothetical protein
MPSNQVILDRLNDAVHRDWKAMQQLVLHRVPVNTTMVDHATVMVIPIQGPRVTSFALGLLGILNGVVREQNADPPIEAQFEDGELTGFSMRGAKAATDQRVVAVANIKIGACYRVKDRTGVVWEGIVEPVPSGKDQGLYLRLADASLACIFLHDVLKVITA